MESLSFFQKIREAARLTESVSYRIIKIKLKVTLVDLNIIISSVYDMRIESFYTESKPTI